MEIKHTIWLCDDCTTIACNGDYSGIESEQRCIDIDAGFADLPGPLSAHFDSESMDGIRAFSSRSCDCCKTHLASERYRFAILG